MYAYIKMAAPHRGGYTPSGIAWVMVEHLNSNDLEQLHSVAHNTLHILRHRRQPLQEPATQQPNVNPLALLPDLLSLYSHEFNISDMCHKYPQMTKHNLEV